MISECIYLTIVHVLTEIKIIEQQKQMNRTSTWRINIGDCVLKDLCVEPKHTTHKPLTTVTPGSIFVMWLPES